MASSDHRYGYGSFTGSMSEGMNTEDAFQTWCVSQGYSVLKATETDNKLAHVDFRVTDPASGKHVWVDVKASKRRSKSVSAPVGEYVWIEMHGVSGPGWVFGKADFIAICEPHGSWLMIPRADLAVFAMGKVPDPTAGGVVVTDTDAACDTKLYQRKEMEKLILVKTSELRGLGKTGLFE